MKKITRKSLVIGLIAGILVFLDGVIAKLLGQTGSFTWIAFVSWTVFFSSKTDERLKAILGYVIGFVAAVVIMKLGEFLSFMPSVVGVSLGAMLATIIVNFACIELENFEKHFPLSVSGIFVGIAMTFSGLGVGLTINTLESSILMLIIIVLYGILGLISGWATLKFGVKN